MCSPDIFLGLIAILFPPLAVWVKCGICSADSLINILLCMLGFIPGLLHAWYIIAKYPENSYDYEPVAGDEERGHITYVVVQGPNGQQRVSKGSRVVRNQGYGTTATMVPGPQGAAAAPRVGQNTNGTWGGGDANGVNGGEGSSGSAVPPTYAEAVKGDNKVQTP